MPRALWKGAISFGLIYVPVEVHTASKENTLPLHMLDSRDFAPVGYQRVNKNTGKEVDWSHIIASPARRPRRLRRGGIASPQMGIWCS
jgi:DNA end-binding protein Ku